MGFGGVQPGDTHADKAHGPAGLPGVLQERQGRVIDDIGLGGGLAEGGLAGDAC